MAMYDELSDIAKQIFKGIKDSNRADEYIRLVSYDDKDALTTNETLPSFNDLMWDRNFPFIKPLDPEKEKGTYVMVYYKDGGFAGANNVYQHDGNFCLDFLCHKDTWALNDFIVRPYSLLGVIYESVSKIKLEHSIRGKFVISAPKLITSHNGTYAGYSIVFNYTDGTGC